MRYEDLLRDQESEMGRLLSFLNWKIEPVRVRNAMEQSSAPRMRRLEKEKGLWKRIRNIRTDIPFVRNASAEGWKNELPDWAAKRIWDEWGEVMVSLGYSS